MSNAQMTALLAFDDLIRDLELRDPDVVLLDQRMQQELLHLALRDELTGLYNRRAFRVLATQSLRLARRRQQRVLLFFADLDGLKRINDRLGHREGDRALARAAAGFKATFSAKSDIVARLGGDEFVALAVEEPGRSAEDLCRRLRRSVATRGARERRYGLSLSFGIASFDGKHPLSLSELMAQADAALYRHKRTVRAEAAVSGEAASRVIPLELGAPVLS